MIIAMSESLEAGDQAEEFSAVYARLHDDLFRYCLVLTRSVEDAEDVAGETFERALRAWSRDRTPSAQPLPWLLLTARRIAIDRARRRRLLRWLPLSAAPRSTSAVFDQDRIDFWLWFDSLSTALTSRQREVLLLRYQSDLTDAQIGRILGLSEPGVRSLASRAVSSLRQHPELLR
jgi:RNA polymerase sigma factor (sigma-70 family)